MFVVIASACWVVIPVFDVFSTIAVACSVVIPTLAVFAATASVSLDVFAYNA